jgi:hypothetical protein
MEGDLTWRERNPDLDPFLFPWRVRLISPSHRGHLIVCFVVVLVGYFGGMYTPGEVAFDGIMEMCHQFGSLFPCEYDESILKACFFSYLD